MLVFSFFVLYYRLFIWNLKETRPKRGSWLTEHTILGMFGENLTPVSMSRTKQINRPNLTNGWKIWKLLKIRENMIQHGKSSMKSPGKIQNLTLRSRKGMGRLHLVRKNSSMSGDCTLVLSSTMTMDHQSLSYLHQPSRIFQYVKTHQPLTKQEKQFKEWETTEQLVWTTL